MTIKEENAEALGFLDITYVDERSKELLAFARDNGLEKGTVKLPNGDFHSAAAFAQHLYCNAYEIANPPDSENESYQIVALLITLQMISKSSWNYGSRLLYDLKAAGFQLKREEVAAFLAQEGTYSTNRSKGDLLDGNMTAVSMYCGTLRALYNTLPGIGKGLSSPDTEPMQQLLAAREESPMATIEKLALTYIPALIGEENRGKVERFLKFLRNSDFYVAPASTRYHLAVPGGQSTHIVNVIYRTAERLLPASNAQIGEIVMAALCHDLCKVNVYFPRDEGGYYFHDEMPFGHGRKSLYMAVGFFGHLMPKSVASAIDAHMHDIDTNPNVGIQMMEQPLGLFLHIGDMLAAHIDEVAEHST